MDFQATLSFLRVLIDRELNGRNIVREGYLAEAVTRFGKPFELTDVDHTRLTKHLETVYGTRQENGHLLRGNFVDWYPQARGRLAFYYWGRLEKYWKDHSVLPVEVIRSVDTVTDEIMEYLGNPSDHKNWNRRRGLVMGHVQMGKTTNYSALIAKAADAGYRIIIVLAGLTNSLRYQTQVRLDKTFVGKSSASDSTHAKIYDVARVFVGEIEGYILRHPFCGTTQLSDFNTNSATGVGAHQGNFAEPILFVTKKNPKVLESLTDWLSGMNHGEKLDGPMLLIDDEADNASVNTSRDSKLTSRINEQIRGLLNTAKQSTYVGYTATPFANIFIDPDSTDKWDREDLFPADFIKSLDPPNNYVGASRLFLESGDLHSTCVRAIPSDYVSLLPLAHKSHHLIKELPASLEDAVREYVLCRAIRIHSGDGSDHSAMLVNVSRYNAVQAQIKKLIDSKILEFKQAIETWAMSNWQKSSVLIELRRVWDAEYSAIGSQHLDWDSVRPHLTEAIRSISSKLVNMKGAGIDYESAPPTGLHVIAIGGLALARGLTLEGLTVSYVLRNVGAADTLLQMGRWFGYRNGFEQICRIHAPPALLADFADVCESVEELRQDFERMERLGKTPFEFGLKVRQSATGIAITAANKMRSAKSISLAEDFSIRHLQAHTLFNDNAINLKNYEVVERLHAELSTSTGLLQDEHALVGKNVPVSLILKFLADIDLPQTEFNALDEAGQSLVGAYISDRAESELKSWDLAFPFKVSQDSDNKGIEFPFSLPDGTAAFCRSRKSGSILEGGKLVKVSEKNAVTFGDDDLAYGEPDLQKKVAALLKSEQEKSKNGKSRPLSWGYAMCRTRPLLVVHLLNFDATAQNGMIPTPLRLKRGLPVVSISILFPGTQVPCKERNYRASMRLMQMLEELRSSEETDEEIVDE